LLTSNALEKVGLFTVFASLIAAVGCGSSPVVPHQAGHYSNASFKGSYVFQMHGFTQNSTTGELDPYREVGVITADGNGNITAGADSAGAVGAAQSSSGITGTYSIGQDGTGTITLNSTAFGALFQSSITLAVTLSSTSNALLLESDVFADGAGTAELQDPAAISALPSGAFVFGIHQESFAGTGASASQVGVLTVAGGKVTGGSMDQNLLPGSAALLNLTGGSLANPTSLGTASGAFTDSSGTTTDFSYYIVNSGKFAFLVTNSGAVGSGSAEAQSGPVKSGLSGAYVFGSRGDDSSGNATVATVGQFTSSAGSFSGAVDAMQDGNYSGLVKVTGTRGTTSAQGRTQVAVSGGPTMIFWMVSPSRAFFLDENESAAEDGTADLQTSSSFSAASMKGQYALGMDGIDLTPEAVGRVGTLQFDGSHAITLVALENDSTSGAGAQSPGTLGGTYQVGGSGRITTEITNNSGAGPDLVLYAVSPAQAYALQIDGGVNTSGTITLQQ